MISSTRDILLVWGGLELHEPEQTSEIVTGLLQSEGLSVEVTDDLAAFDRPDLGRFRLIIPNITGGEISFEALKNLVGAVRGGTGLGGFHAGLATTFRGQIDFHYMTGCFWVKHPGDIIDYRVEVARPDDPVMAGIESFDYRSEQYYMLVDPSIKVLATTTFDGKADYATEGVVMPVVYKRRFGKGRIFYSSLGHVAREFDNDSMRTILLRGLMWAAGR